MNWQAALDAAGGDRDLLAELAGEFDREADALLGQLQDAIAEADAGRVRRAAHTLKGSRPLARLQSEVARIRRCLAEFAANHQTK